MLKNKLANRILYEDNGDVNPMDGMSNLSDAMLVLAVGIMLALVINWRIDIKTSQQDVMTEVSEDKMQEIEYEMLNENQSPVSSDEQNFHKSGTVWTDSKTGKTYVIMDE